MTTQHKTSIPQAAQAFDNLADAALIDDKSVAAIFGCSRKTVWARAKNDLGIWPKAIKVSPKQTRFRVGDVRKALSALVSQA